MLYLNVLQKEFWKSFIIWYLTGHSWFLTLYWQLLIWHSGILFQVDNLSIYFWFNTKSVTWLLLTVSYHIKISSKYFKIFRNTINLLYSSVMLSDTKIRSITAYFLYMICLHAFTKLKMNVVFWLLKVLAFYQAYLII